MSESPVTQVHQNLSANNISLVRKTIIVDISELILEMYFVNDKC